MEITGDFEQEKIIDELQNWFECNEKLPMKIGKLLTKIIKSIFENSKKNVKASRENFILRKNIR